MRGGLEWYEECPPTIPSIRPAAFTASARQRRASGGRRESRGGGAVERANRMMVVYGLVPQGVGLCARLCNGWGEALDALCSSPADPRGKEIGEGGVSPHITVTDRGLLSQSWGTYPAPEDVCQWVSPTQGCVSRQVQEKKTLSSACTYYSFLSFNNNLL